MKYKNITHEPHHLIGLGTVEPGAIIETTTEINNGNFALVEEVKPKVDKPDEEN